MKIKPIEEINADERTRVIYKEIKQSLDVVSVPIVFKFMANFPDFLQFAWEKLMPVVTDISFNKSSEKIAKLSDEVIKIIFNPNAKLAAYVNSLNPTQKEEIQETISELKTLNAKLLLITIAIRESLKGISIPNQKFIEGVSYAGNFSIQQLKSENPSDLLIPDFGVEYEEFYALINQNMSELLKTEKYLRSRVEIEKFSQLSIEQLPKPIIFPFSETVSLLRKYPYSSELLFLLNSTFPSNYPNMLFTSSAIERSLNPKSELKSIRN